MGSRSTYNFRIRFNLPDSLRININDGKVELAELASGHKVVLKGQRDKAIKDSDRLAIIGYDFDTEEEALDAAKKWRNTAETALAHEYFGVDFGDRAATRGYLTQAGIQLLEQEHGLRVLNDEHGTMVYTTLPKPLLFETSAKAVKLLNAEKLLRVIKLTHEARPEVSEPERIAYDLFASSYLYPKPDARFLALMMAIETLAERQPRSRETISHIETLIGITRSAQINDAQSLLSALSDMKKESIASACKVLASRLIDKQYANRDAVSFMGHCYGLRSKLVHGSNPRPTNQDINEVVADLERFVGDLLGLKSGVPLN